MRAILTTVGTSLLSNARRVNKETNPNETELIHYLNSTEPAKASAETNSLSRLLQESDKVVLLHSQTEEGRLCGDILSKFYRSQGFQAETVEIRDLCYTESQFKVRGLRSLVTALVEQIQENRKKGYTVIINATGGFKAETAYATLVGLLFDVKVYYIYEAIQEIVEMPPIPLDWDYSLFAEHESLFEWLAGDYRAKKETGPRTKDLPLKARVLIEEEEGLVTLSAVGIALLEAYREFKAEAKGVRVLLSSRARQTYGDADPTTRALYDSMLEKLSKGLWRYAAEWVGDSGMMVWPRGSKRERAIFYENESGSILVCELALHGGSYEKLMDRKPKRNEYRDFEPWQEGM
jgi:putative CRISPR-associated protein (TIGR02619 family)